MSASITAPDFDFSRYVRDRARLVNDALDRYTPTDSVHPTVLHAAMRYSLFAGGKRIRPLLCIASAEALGGTTEDVLPTACALEMVHTFSLIHDDLPAIDDDDYRRGLLTSHKKFGEAIAILAGDALHTLAFTTIAMHQQAAQPTVIIEVIRRLALASGTLGMVGGQVDDIASEGKAISAEVLRSIHARKTGALLNAAIETGALLANASEADLVSLQRFGEQVGLAFQIVDDILDVTSDDATLGKPTGSDEKNDKATYPKLFGLEASIGFAREASDAAIAAIRSFGPAAEPLRCFARFIVDREK
ncbi:MAG: polyprenyl synthetase family protein [Cytophagales bacterium]|nr:polyprenyl synthetase family protein [Armatimonadota bacterium]